MPNDDRLICVIGCPGSGKGTLIPEIARQKGFKHVSVGDELRKYVKNDGRDTMTADLVERSVLLPAKKLAKVLESVLSKLRGEGHESIILDGFPRDVDQIALVEKRIGRPKHIFFFDCPRQIARQRVVSRKLAGRIDSAEIFDRRYAEFEEKNPKVVEHYDIRGILTKVDTSAETSVTLPLFQKAWQELEAPEPDFTHRPLICTNLVYLIGPPSTGKTILINDVIKHTNRVCPIQRITDIPETPQESSQRSLIPPADDRASTVHAACIQAELLEKQFAKEGVRINEIEQNDASDGTLVLADRSGADPVVFVEAYGNERQARELVESREWQVLRQRMMNSLVILCKPVTPWHVGEGSNRRLVTHKEMDELYGAHCRVLGAQRISFRVLHWQVTNRVQFVADEVAKYVDASVKDGRMDA